jgi:hypothetical protein
MSFSENPQQMRNEPGDSPAPHPSTPPNASGTVAADHSNLEKSIQNACKFLKRIFPLEYDDDWIKDNLSLTWVIVREAISGAGGSNMKERLKKMSEFRAYVMPGSHGERELIKLMRSMVKLEVPWTDLFENGTLLSFL